MTRTRVRFLLAAALVAVCAARPARGAGPAGAGADKEKEACISEYEKAQVLRKNGKLVEAKEKLLVCAQSTCPSIARQDCATWLTEVSSSIPTVVVEATDPSGRVATNVRVVVDGEVIAEKLDGTALPVNPGAHQFRFELAEERGTKAHEESVLVLQGDRNRKISVSFAPPPPERTETQAPPRREETSRREEPPPVKSSARAPVAGFVLAGVSAVGLASFAIFGLTGISKENTLRSTCAPACAKSDVDSVVNRYRVADASLVIGIVSGAVATWLLWPRDEPARAGRAHVTPSVGPKGAGVSLEVPFL